ncbi:MAG TPA: DUF262 domain-containing protein [Symbiobacteriaceae bacterium]|nr:DUF262 domain-containing protein [Symbiobacteriaceae bacterium]
MTDEQAVALIRAVDKQSLKVRSKALDMSFNELANMYQDEELVIDPDYQRLFRWSEGKQSRFLESLLLEMPIPPIFVIEREDGKYELIDGLQRISSYLHFLGVHKERPGRSLILSDCDILTELNGKSWTQLPTALQIKIKRYFVRVEVIKKESDPKLRYYVFKRLNTGGEILSEQEIRNCSIRLLDSDFMTFVNEMSRNEDYQSCMVNLSEEALEKRQDQEYVLRFLALKNWRQHFVHEVGDFMTQYMEAVADPEVADVTFDFKIERITFERTFRVLNEILGQHIFSRYVKYGGKEPKPVGQLRPNYFEAFSLGVQRDLELIDVTDQEQLDRIRKQFVDLRFDDDFVKVTGAGVNYPRPLNARISLVEKALERALHGS